MPTKFQSLNIQIVTCLLLCASCFAQGNIDERYAAQVRAERERLNPSDRRISNNPETDDRTTKRDPESRQPDLDQDSQRRVRIRNEQIETDTAETSEFQRFIFATTGLKLKIFGSELFRDVPSTFAPVDRISVSADYTIGPGDELILRGWGQIDIDLRTSVDRSGAIFIPKVGNVVVSGLKYSQLQPFLKSEIGRVFHDFDLNVTLGQLRSIQVLIVGQARRPGSYTVSALSTLVNAIFASGGPSSHGSMRHIQLKRNNQVISEFDLYELLLKGDKSKDVHLAAGDVIYIPPIGSVVAIAGSVISPGIYELGSEASLGTVIGFAGGLAPTASGGKATVERITDRAIRSVSEFDLDADGLTNMVRDGDLISIRPLSARFDNAVTLRGNVANPGRYPWKPGMRVKDIIPTREALVTRSYWSKQDELGQDIRTNSVRKRESKSETGVERTSADARQDRLFGDDGFGPPTELGRRGNEDAESANSGLKPKTSAKDRKQSLGEIKLRNEISANEPSINWDYAVVQRLKADLSTTLIPFNLGLAVENAQNPSNVDLQPGDVITIFSQADIKVPQAKRTKFVRLEGEFNVAGVYELQAGETLRELIKRAGGLTSAAYVYGAELTRESARESQQEKLDDLLDRTEREVERSSSTRSQNVVSVEEAAGLKERVDSQRRLVAKLRTIQATGRVVLGLQPSARGADALPDLVLEDGDQLYIPYRPATVNVVGAVYNDSSFLHDPMYSVSFYLRQAGGGTKQADTGHTFLVRANGTIVTKDRSSGWFSGGFEKIKPMPGDTIVIPEQLDKVSVLKGLKDWSQVVAQFALGVAAIKSLTRP